MAAGASAGTTSSLTTLSGDVAGFAWAVIAAYWTLGVLFGYACLGFAVNRYFQRNYLPLPTVPFVYSVVCYFVLRSTDLAQSIAAHRPKLTPRLRKTSALFYAISQLCPRRV